MVLLWFESSLLLPCPIMPNFASKWDDTSTIILKTDTALLPQVQPVYTFLCFLCEKLPPSCMHRCLPCLWTSPFQYCTSFGSQQKWRLSFPSFLIINILEYYVNALLIQSLHFVRSGRWKALNRPKAPQPLPGRRSRLMSGCTILLPAHISVAGLPSWRICFQQQYRAFKSKYLR